MRRNLRRKLLSNILRKYNKKIGSTKIVLVNKEKYGIIEDGIRIEPDWNVNSFSKNFKNEYLQ